MENQIQMLAEAIKNANKICVFTGAGISCPSGIPDFRSADGLYNQKSNNNYRPEEIISHSFFCAHPEMFYEFYKSKMVYQSAKPNTAHLFFAELEKGGKDVSVVTQNIDNLHQAAGSKNVLELHGSVHRNYCTKCGKPYNLDYVMKADGVPYCADGGIIKPDVVLYEEPLDETIVEKAIAAIGSAELMLVIGTSLTVYPAASYVRFFRGNTLALINKSQTDFDERADIAINDDVVKVVAEIKKIM